MSKKSKVLVVCICTVLVALSVIFFLVSRGRRGSTLTFVGKSEHWKANYTEHVKLVSGSTWQTDFASTLSISWTGTTDKYPKEASYKFFGPEGLILECSNMVTGPNSLSPYVHYNGGRNLLTAKSDSVFTLTIIWDKSNSETLTLVVS